MAVQVVSQIRLKQPRKFHLCFTCCLFGFSQIADYQCITRYSSSLVFRSKRLAAMRGVFVMPWFALLGSCTSLACTGNLQQNDVSMYKSREFAGYRPDSDRLDQKNATGSASRSTSQTCTSRHRLRRFLFPIGGRRNQ